MALDIETTKAAAINQNQIMRNWMELVRLQLDVIVPPASDNELLYTDASGNFQSTKLQYTYDAINNIGGLDVLSDSAVYGNIRFNNQGGDALFGGRIVGGPDGPGLASTFSYLKGLVLGNNSLTSGDILCGVYGKSDASNVLSDFTHDVANNAAYADTASLRTIMRQISGTTTFPTLLRSIENHTLRSAAATGGANNGTWGQESSIESEVAGNTIDQGVGLRMDCTINQWSIGVGVRQDTAIYILGDAGWYNYIRAHDETGTCVFNVDQDGIIYGKKLTLGSTGSTFTPTSGSLIDIRTDLGLSPFIAYMYGGSGGGGGFVFNSARGTIAAPSQILANDVLSGFFSAGYTSAGAFSANVVAIQTRASEDFTSTANGTYITFLTTTNGATSRSERVRIDNAGRVLIANTTGTNQLDVTGSFGIGAPVTKTADFTVAATENWLICNKAGITTVTLPTASAWVGRIIILLTITANTVVSASSNVVPLAGGAAGTAILAATAGRWACLVSNGTNWKIMMAA